MARRRTRGLIFPAGGECQRFSYQAQPPYTTVSAKNVCAEDPLEERVRGGSRPGLQKRFALQLGSGSPIRMLAPLHTIPTPQTLIVFTDTFTDMSNWTVGPFGEIAVASGGKATKSGGNGTCGAVLGAKSIDVARPLIVRALVQIKNDAEYRLYLGMDDTSPQTSASLSLRVRFEGVDEAEPGLLRIWAYKDDVAQSWTVYPWSWDFAEGDYIWMVLKINDNWEFEGYTPQLYYPQSVIRFHLGYYSLAGSRIGFSLTQADGVPCMDDIEYEYFSTPTASYPSRMIMASANGLTYAEQTDGSMAAVTTSNPPTLASDRMVSAAQRQGKLYIADYELRIGRKDATGNMNVSGVLDATGVDNWNTYGIDTDSDVVEVSEVSEASSLSANGVSISDNGGFIAKITSINATSGLTLTNVTGTCSACNFRVIRSPKVYDPATDTLSMWWVTSPSTKGQVPAGATIIDVYKDRMVLTGDPDYPGQWYMSRQGDPNDWKYTIGAQAPVASDSTDSDVGGVPEPVTAMAAISDDYLIFAALNQLWILRGDPMMAGILDNVSYNVGIIHHAAWCRLPDNTLIFMANDGVLYSLPPGGAGDPVPLSKEKIPKVFEGLDPEQTDIALAYDVERQKVHIYVTGISGPGAQHYWFDWPTQGPIRMELDVNHEPTAICVSDRDNRILLGCRDGYIRHFADGQEVDDDDDAISIASHVLYGPIRLGSDERHDGSVVEIEAVLDNDSGDLNWELLVGETPEAALASEAIASGTWSAGRNYPDHPFVGGHVAYLRLSNAGDDAWAVESISVLTEEMGLQPVLA